MNEADDKLAQQLKQAMPEARRVPGFEESWRAAEHRAGRNRHRLHVAAAAAVAAIAMLVLVDTPGPGEPALEYIEIAELLESTSWTAPSDTLLPEREFDIYQELPALMESTEERKGALL